jgi:dTDP-4-amino-4,6-dideoxygalactose transaminase
MKNIPLVNLVRQYNTIKKEIKQETQKVYDKGDYVLGEDVELFEKEFAKYCDSKYSVGVGSGLDAILLLLRAYNIGKGDEVITVSNTFISTVLPILHVGAKPIFIDIDPVTKSMDINLLEKALTSKTRAILPVHLFGYPVNIDAIKKVISGRKIYIIEDAAQAHGSLYKGKKCGSFGDAAAFSFYPGKNLGAYGEAGAVVSNDEEIMNKVKMLRNIGQEKKYYNSMVGYNSRLDTLQAAVLRVKLRHLDDWNGKRRQHAKLYTSLLQNVVSIPIEQEGYKTNYHVYCIETDKRDALAKYLSEKGIATSIHYPVPVHLQKCMSDVTYQKHNLHITEAKAKQILSLPIFPELTNKEIQYIAQAVNNFYTN